MDMEKRTDLLKRILTFTKPYWLYLAGAVVSALLSVSMVLYAPILIGKGIDQIVAPGKVAFDQLLPILGELIVVALLGALFQWLMTLCTNMVTYKTVRDLRVCVFNKLEEIPLSKIDSRSHGDIISRIINDIDSISDGLLQGFSQLFTGIITIVITLGYMLAINFKVGMVVVVITPLSLFVASFIAKHSFSMFRRQSAIKGQLSGCIEELVGNQKVVKAFCYEERAQKEFDRINHELYDAGVKAQFYSSLTNPCTRFVNSAKRSGAQYGYQTFFYTSCGIALVYPEDLVIFPRLWLRQFSGSVAQNTESHAAISFRNPPLFQQCFSGFAVKCFSCTVNPAAAQTDSVCCIQHGTHGKAAVFYPCVYCGIYQYQNCHRCSIKRIPICCTHDLCVLIGQLVQHFRISYHHKFGRHTVHACGSILSGS